MKVCIDAGHGGHDPGAIGPSGVKEKDVNLAVALKLGEMLRTRKIDVVYTRKNDSHDFPRDQKQNLAKRVSIANTSKADIFVSIHCNSANNRQARGMEIYTTVGRTKADILAEKIIESWKETFKNPIIRKDISDGDSDKEANFYVLKYTRMPAVLIELGFISNPEEEKELSSDSFQTKAAEAISRGIYSFKL